MSGAMGAPEFVVMQAWDITSHQYIPVAVGAVQVDPVTKGQYGVLQITGGGGGGGGSSDISLHDFNTIANHLSIDASGRIQIGNFPGSQPVTGTFWQATQPVSGTFWQATQPVSGAVSVSNFPGSQAVTGTFWQAIQPISGTVAVNNFPASQAVTGTFWQTTQPVSGVFWQATQPVSIAATVPVNIAAAAGAIGVTNANGATIAATTDYLIVFSSQVNHFALENNTAATIQWELDAVTSASSMHLPNTAPGNLLLMDVKVTTVHVLSPGATIVNGASGINIRGWL